MNGIRLHMLFLLASLVISAACLLYFPVSAMAQQETEILLSKGMEALLRGDNAAAVEKIREALELAPDNEKIQLQLAIALNRMEEYQEAAEILGKVVKKKPEWTDALCELGISYIGQGAVDEAIQILNAAQQISPEKGQVYYLLGLAYYNKKKWRASLRYYKRARELDPFLAGECHYTAGVSYLHLAYYIQARNEFLKSIEADPESEYARASEEYLKFVDGILERGKYVSAVIRSGYEYDSNVMLLPDDKEVYAISQKDDFRFFVSSSVEIHPWRAHLWDLGVRYNFYQSVHNRIGNYNMQGHSIRPALFLKTRPIEPFVAYEYDYFLLDDCKMDFLRQNSIQAGFNIYESARYLTTLSYQLLLEDYLTTIPTKVDNPDAKNHTIGISQYLPVPLTRETFLTLGMYYDRNNSRGINYDYNGYKLYATVTTPLFARFRFDASAEYYIRDFQHHTMGRQDTRQTYAVRLSRPLNKYLEVGTQYLLMVNRSQAKPYRFNRDVFTVDVTARF